MTTLLTGATGYLGRAIFEMLAESGESLRVFCRFPDKLGPLADKPNVEVFQGDLEDPENIAEAVRGVKRVYHVAGAVKEWVKDWSVFETINVLAWENIVRAAMAQKVERIVYTASFMALGPTEQDRDGDESLIHDPKHFHNPYESTKYQAFINTKKYIEQGAPIVVLCPGVIFGPGPLTDGNFAAGLIKQLADKALPGVPGGGKTRWCFSYIKDVAKGHILAMEKGGVGQVYILGGENHSFGHFIDEVCAKTDIEKPKRNVPLWFLWVGAAMMEAYAKISGSPPMITRGRVGVMKHHWTYKSDKAIGEIDYAISPFDKALSDTLDWMKKESVF